jgi:hypothetical protein
LIASIYSYDIFPISHLAKLISSLIILSFKHQNQQGGLDALSLVKITLAQKRIRSQSARKATLPTFASWASLQEMSLTLTPI